MHCHKLFENLLSNMNTDTPAGPVPKAVPEELREDFLLGGLVNLTLLYFDQRHRGETVPYNWTAAVIGTYCILVSKKPAEPLVPECRKALPVHIKGKATKHPSQSHACPRPVPASCLKAYHYGSHPAICAAAESYMMRAEVEDGFEDVAYSETALVYQALEDFPVMGQAGLVIGSIMPWAEAILFLAGARACCGRVACSQGSAC